MSQKQSKMYRRQIRKETNRIYDSAFEYYACSYNNLTLWQKIKLAFKTERVKRKGK